MKMAEKDDGLLLGLSLSLKCCGGDSQRDTLHQQQQPPPPPFPLNLMQSMPLPFMQQPQKSPVFDAFQTSNDRNNAEIRTFFRGIDVNQPVTAINCEEDVVVSSPNSTVSSVSGKRCEREENEAERGSSSFEDDGGEAARKKLRLSKEQAVVLEETFKEHSTLNPKQKLALAKQLNLRPRQVEVWFQNRRARTKLKQTELDCEYLRRCCETLTEENKRLQKEANELRTLKLSPQFYTNMNPPTTLTMCPQCERVNVSSSLSSATSTSLALVSSSTGINRQQHLGTAARNQRPITMNPWASIIPPQPVDVHGPRS